MPFPTQLDRAIADMEAELSAAAAAHAAKPKSQKLRELIDHQSKAILAGVGRIRAERDWKAKLARTNRGAGGFYSSTAAIEWREIARLRRSCAKLRRELRTLEAPVVMKAAA